MEGAQYVQIRIDPGNLCLSHTRREAMIEPPFGLPLFGIVTPYSFVSVGRVDGDHYHCALWDEDGCLRRAFETRDRCRER